MSALLVLSIVAVIGVAIIATLITTGGRTYREDAALDYDRADEACRIEAAETRRAQVGRELATEIIARRGK